MVDWDQTTAEPCPYCGAINVGGYEGCRELMNQLIVRFGHDRLAVDCYMLQHPEIGCVSAKSYVAHLSGLCVAMEFRESENIHAAIQRWLNGRVKLEKPRVIQSRGKLTITHIQAVKKKAEYPKAAKEWAARVWDAYAGLHDMARSYVSRALWQQGD